VIRASSGFGMITDVRDGVGNRLTTVAVDVTLNEGGQPDRKVDGGCQDAAFCASTSMTTLAVDPRPLDLGST
jgi:hypothetical protein